ncbi:nitroreductase family deazaflavin-dependent oxidoreductase [Nocardia sp. CDC159]|uniref:Nitroreductase family deazaflavin-dependent oxidoreductase n=1 Tax=Nocardia pulmonis TaxID=2951408 RepID=A0A9X2ITZ8_9NOCA|nr:MULTISPECIES: nitroreductase family deazaflavin-dependent oxidoreductase [Nocardia]MCM6772327.1 nitroreductase family deazaflavin-dependent oxidoreductase [Nocardia pulmonis]MCM6785015.1 nitroreductase family deazaflavin-dependent oxidoreductase [Nocardia sp. CDC159]
MNEPAIGPIPDSLRYRDGDYTPERFRRRDQPPTLRQIRRLTRPLRALHSVWFTVRLPHGVGVLTTTGRKSGKPRRTFVKAIREGDRAYLVSIRGERALWLKNIRADPVVSVRLRDGTFTGVVRDLRDDSERRAAYLALCDRVHAFDYAENAFHRRGLPSRTKILELHRAWFEGGTPLVVDLDPAGVNGRSGRRR